MGGIIEVRVATELCAKCFRCVRVCPSKVFSVKKDNDGNVSVVADTSMGCIACGHCMDVCEHDAVVHSSFELSARHGVNRYNLPAADALMNLMKIRRSNRAFKREAVPADALDRIVDAATLAPTATNARELSFVVVTDPERLHKISECVVEEFSDMRKKLTNPFLRPFLRMVAPDLIRYANVFRRIENAYKEGEDQILRGATAVILICAPRKARFGIHDANLAYQNGSLMAENLGVSQFYTGFVCSAINRKRGRRLLKEMGIDGEVKAGMALGMPSFYYPYYLDRDPVKVTKL